MEFNFSISRLDSSIFQAIDLYSSRNVLRNKTYVKEVMFIYVVYILLRYVILLNFGTR
jgi:hypothetical protein